MSKHRINPNAKWVNPKDLPKGPNGRALCRKCGTEVPKGRRTFCSQECVDAWVITSNPGRARQLVFKRDKGVCASCGLDTVALQKSIEPYRWVRPEEIRKLLESHGISPYAVYSGEFWQADHIVEVADGGGECGLENYQTLCTRCHKAKTAKLAAERAARRRRDKADRDDLGR